MLVLFLLGAGGEKNKSPKMLRTQRAESRLGFPEVSGPPGFSSPPLGPPPLWLPGTVWQSWLQTRAWAGFVLFSRFGARRVGVPLVAELKDQNTRGKERRGEKKEGKQADNFLEG